MKYYAALDVSLRTVNVCVIDEQGTIQAESKLASEVDDIVSFLRGLRVTITSVGFEAGTLTQYLSDGLQSAGFDVVCMEAKRPQVPCNPISPFPCRVVSPRSHQQASFTHNRVSVILTIRPGYVLVGVTLRERFGHGIAVTSSLENLLGTQYQTATGYNTPGRSLFVRLEYNSL